MSGRETEMIKIKLEEAMGYRGNDMRQLLLLAGVGVLACALAGGLCGCGSDETQPVSRQDKKPEATEIAKPQVKEVLIKTNRGASSIPAQLLQRTDPGKIEVVPPARSGERGLTRAELNAKAGSTAPIDPASVEVVPPSKPGERGLTRAELKAMADSAAPEAPASVEVVPPSKPGERGLTRAELKAMTDSAAPVDPDSIEVVPPSKPGERGLTRAELNALAGDVAPVDPARVEVVPPSKPGERGLTRAELNALAASR